MGPGLVLDEWGTDCGYVGRYDETVSFPVNGWIRPLRLLPVRSAVIPPLYSRPKWPSDYIGRVLVLGGPAFRVVSDFHRRHSRESGADISWLTCRRNKHWAAANSIGALLIARAPPSGARSSVVLFAPDSFPEQTAMSGLFDVNTLLIRCLSRVMSLFVITYRRCLRSVAHHYL